MERSQSRLSLSASFEALAIYFPCMNSFDEEDADGDGRRLKGAIQRSTETGLAVEMPSRTVRQASHESIEDSMNSYGSEGNLNFSGVHLASAGQFSDFLGSMGPAQFVGRQTLATTSMGDVEIGLQERNGQLEVDIIQARGLTPKPGSKTLPGDSLGKLRTHGTQALHGSRQGPAGRTGFVNFSNRLVQALPNLLDGGSHYRPAPASVLTAFLGEHSGTLL
ncbi:regulating synaptic membrane exocytosis protein 4 isoform X4 [Rissa tridactyla]|uniref:regulating synaptic membrane exocytosis protein 4 isoform X4 n=1 Tax=Rissa tridactyla TaxID=75485 RepID=UPI0023BAAE1A|nr:regulating synaptic membrane exocytosis protein 4 isoform X4 [Rissa tridactyla]